VLRALENGALSPARLENARKLEAELRHQRMRTDARLRQEQRQQSRQIMRAVRAQGRKRNREG
jgi:hypothetical protein